MEKLIVENSTDINAPIATVWDVLTNPEMTKKYMFGCKAVSDWKIGSSLCWNATVDGQEITFVKGIILEIEPNKLLKYTVIDPNGIIADIPKNYLNVAYYLEEVGKLTRLKVVQDGFEDAADGEKRYKEVFNNGEGWNPILTEIKKIVEVN